MAELEKHLCSLLREVCPKEDLSRQGLIDTPERWIKSMKELCSGYDEDPSEILSTKFDVLDHPTSTLRDPSQDLVVFLQGISVFSLCEHHLLPFVGTASIAYTPREGGQVYGVSKIARLVDCFARRLQIQERLTSQIAEALARDSEGVLVMIRAQHLCMQMRGVRKQIASMTTQDGRGIYNRNGASYRSGIERLVISGLND